MGMITVRDLPRKEARDVVDGLKALDIKVIMLTGDDVKVAEGVAAELGIEEYRARLLPQDKVRAVEEYQKRYGPLLMAELDIDISGQKSKSLDLFEGQDFDYVVMVCSNAAETCPFFPGGRVQVHHAFDDPASVDGTEEDKLIAFRKNRNQINKWIIDNLVLSNE